MKKIQYLFLLCYLLLTACVGQKGTESSDSLTITASQPNISVSQAESVQLRVKYQSVDVTDQAEIYYTDGGSEIEVVGGLFTATQSGEYSFSARYDQYETESHAIVRAYDDNEVSDSFFRRNLIVKFTGTWCTNCPAMGEAIIEVEHAMTNRIVEIAMHCNDELKTDEGTQMAADNNFSILPIAFVDMYNYTATSSASVLKELVESSTAANPTVAGVRISSTLSSSTLNVEVGAMCSSEGSYKVAVALVTDNFCYPQTGSDDPNYKQDKVLQFYLSELYGDSLTDLAPGTEATKSYQVTLSEVSLSSESRIVAYVLNQVDGKYIVNNATECVVGEAIDYMYEIIE